MRWLLGLAMIVVTACELSATERQMDALNGCTARWRIEYPELYGGEDEASQRRRLMVMEPQDIEFDETGNYVWKQPPDRWRAEYDDQFVCHGNIESRTIEYVSHNSEIRRPPVGVVWRFE